MILRRSTVIPSLRVKLQTIFTLLLVCLPVPSSLNGAEPKVRDAEALSTAVKLIERLGGKITVDNSLPSKPIIGVDLSDTRVSDQDLEVLKHIHTLQWLALNGTQLRGGGLKELRELKTLRRLELCNTQVTTARLRALKELQQLQELYLANNEITDEALGELKSLVGLHTLNLNHTQVTDKGLAELKNLTNLQTLDLVGTRITDLGMRELKELKRIRELNLGYTKISDEGLRSLRNLEHLEILDLMRTKVTDAGMKELKGMSKLQSLNLIAIGLSDEGLKHLTELTNLRTLRLGGRIGDSKVTGGGLAEFRKKLPSARVILRDEDADEADAKRFNADQLIAALKSDDRAANDRALTFLFHLDSRGKCEELGGRKKDIVTALIPYLDNVEERKNVLRILGKIGPDAKAAVPGIVRFIKRSTPADDRLALAAQYALRDIGENAAAAVPELIDSSQPFFFGRFNNVQYRCALPITLVAIAPKDPKVRDFLRKGLKDEEAGVRVHAAWKLWQLGVRGAELTEIWTQAQKGEDAVVRGRVGIITAWLARESPELLDLAVSALKDPDRDVRRETIDMLVAGDFTQPKLMNTYLETLSDLDWFVRASACNGLGKMGAKAAQAVPQLKKALQDKEMMVRVDGARALYAVDPNTAPVVVEVLTHALADSDNLVRSAAAKGLGEVGPAARSALPVLRRALADEWSDVRTSAAEAIKAIEKNLPR